MNINYPIKYTTMPIYEQTGWSHGLHELERKYEITCYIVSKCYLLSDSTKYKENGEEYKEYEIVFPYQLDRHNIGERTVPLFNIYDDHCTNSNIVSSVFDSYEEALNEATNKNKGLYYKKISHLSKAEDIEKYEDDFYDKLAKYTMLEKQILMRISNLENSKRKKLGKLINNHGIVSSYNLYELIKYGISDRFYVFTITQQQYDKLVKWTNGDYFDNILKLIPNAQLLLIHEKDSSSIRIMNDNSNDTYYIDKDNVLKSYKDVSKSSDVKLKKASTIFFTTETVDDLMECYKTYEDIDLNKIQGPVLKKTKTF